LSIKNEGIKAVLINKSTRGKKKNEEKKRRKRNE
jgi:hypothetical protein